MHPKTPFDLKSPLAGACAEYIVLIQKQRMTRLKNIYVYFSPLMFFQISMLILHKSLQLNGKVKAVHTNLFQKLVLGELALLVNVWIVMTA